MRTLAFIVTPLALVAALAMVVLGIVTDANPYANATPTRISDPTRISVPLGRETVVYGVTAPKDDVTAHDLGCRYVWDGGSRESFDRLDMLFGAKEITVDGVRYYPLLQIPTKHSGRTLSCTDVGAYGPLVSLDLGRGGTHAPLVKYGAFALAFVALLFASACGLFLALSRTRREV